MTRRRILLSLTYGRTVRDLLENGLLERLCDAGIETVVLTRAAGYAPFRERWERDGVTVRDFEPTTAGAVSKRLAALRRWAFRRSFVLGRSVRRFIEDFAYRDRWAERTLAETQPDLVVATHAHLAQEAGLVAAARRRGIPTLGLVQSWDNVFKGLLTSTDRTAVWNRINAAELTRLEGVPPECIDQIGPVQFDPYFQEAFELTRDDVAGSLGLDPQRPIVLFGSLGGFWRELDETFWMDATLQACRDVPELRDAQIVCRLHPWSKFEQFVRFTRHANVRLQYVDRYLPGLLWTMTREDVVGVGGLLNHADVVISPGSTLVVEAAIFDTPTIMPVHHDWQPELARTYFEGRVFKNHYRRVRDEGLVTVAYSQAEFREALRRAVTDPASGREQRRRLVEDYVQFTDGRSVNRLTGVICGMLGANAADASNELTAAEHTSPVDAGLVVTR